MTSFDDDVM